MPAVLPPLPGSPEPLAAGERVLLTDRKQRRYLVTLQPGGQWHSHAGSIDHDDLIGGPEGRSLRTTKNMAVTVFRPTRTDYLMKMKRGAQVVYPKDQARIIGLGDVRPGMTVVEAGVGSGALTMALLDAVGPGGHVVSFERREDHLAIARANVAAWYGNEPANWEPRLGDVAVSLGELDAHRVVLDLLEPWLVVEAAASALSPGGVLVAYMPIVTQVMRFDRACTDGGAFADVRTSESLDRGWDVDNLAVRPHHRMVAHTAFLTTARRVLAPEEGGPDAPRPTTGPTVVFAETRDLPHGDGAPGDVPRTAGTADA